LTQKSKESFLTISNKRPFHESDLKNTEKYSQIFSDITDVKEEAEKDIKFEPLSFINIKKGEKYIPTIFKHLESKEERIVKHEKGEVLILVFWTLWFSISWVAVTEILRMLRTKHEKWNGKVRIVTVSLLQDHDEEVSTYIKNSGWEKFKEMMDHYVILNLEGRDFSALFTQTIIIDKFGTIQQIGSYLATEEKTQYYNIVKLPVNFDDKSELTAELSISESPKDLLSIFEIFNSTDLTVNYNCGSTNLDFTAEFAVNNNLTELKAINAEEVELTITDYRINEINKLINPIKERIPDFESKKFIKKKY